MLEIPVETPYLASYRNRAVCGDWMVEVIGLKLWTHHPVIEPVSVRAGNGNLRCGDCRAPCCLSHSIVKSFSRRGPTSVGVPDALDEGEHLAPL